MTRKVINLALQGGGAHGAFTWGALDRLLEDDGIAIEGISATSAGAMNAAALKHGWIIGGNDGARAQLEKLWLEIAGLDGVMPEAMMAWLRAVSPAPAVTARALEASPGVLAGEFVTRMLSPYQFNPLNWNPLRSIVEDLLDYDHVCAAHGPKLFIAATNVRSGKVRIFHGREITPDAIIASTSLPTLYQAVEIDDPATGKREAYWDGGYMGNPAIFPLHRGTKCSDIIIVHINPLHREELPKTSTEILNRVNEISFNTALLHELRSIDFVNRLIDTGVIAEGAMKRNRVHSVSDDGLMTQLGTATKATPNRALILQLKDAGRAAMDRFLGRHRKDLGDHSSLDLRAALSSPGGEV